MICSTSQKGGGVRNSPIWRLRPGGLPATSLLVHIRVLCSALPWTTPQPPKQYEIWAKLTKTGVSQTSSDRTKQVGAVTCSR